MHDCALIHSGFTEEKKHLDLAYQLDRVTIRAY